MAYNRLPVSQGVGNYLRDLQVGVTVYTPPTDMSPGNYLSWPIKVGRLWEPPDRQIVCYDVGGKDPYVSLLIDWWQVQVIVRADKEQYSYAWNKALEVKDVLLGVTPFDMSDGTHVDGITMMGAIAFIGYDEKTRPQFSMNFQVICEEPKGDKSNRDPL